MFLILLFAFGKDKQTELYLEQTCCLKLQNFMDALWTSFSKRKRSPPLTGRGRGTGVNPMDDVKLDVVLSGVDEALEKAERLDEAIRKSKSLADNLASALRNLSVEVKS